MQSECRQANVPATQASRFQRHSSRQKEFGGRQDAIGRTFAMIGPWSAARLGDVQIVMQ